MGSPLLTVFLPNYNYLKGFKKLHGKISSQSKIKKELIEIIISDDSDNNEIKDFLESNPIPFRCKYVTGPQKGAVKNWNSCMKRGGGKYCLFMHHDEFMLNEFFFKNIIDKILTYSPDILILPLVKLKNGVTFLHYPRNFLFLYRIFPSLFFSCNPIGSPSVMLFKRNIWEDFDPNLRWHVDLEWYYRLLRKSKKVLFAKEPELKVCSDLNFIDTETSKLNIKKSAITEKKYIIQKHEIHWLYFSKIFQIFKIPVLIYRLPLYVDQLMGTFRFVDKINHYLKEKLHLFEREKWVKKTLNNLEPGLLILDAGCGSQQYKKFTSHLVYKAQDFGEYVKDDKKMLGKEKGGIGGNQGYKYGHLDYKGNIWEIKEKNDYFDAILCTEVFEHIPKPIDTLKEFSRLLKPGGLLILSAPANSLRHMDPFYFYSGFADRWYERFLPENGFEIKSIEPVGDYYSWLSVELARTASANGALSKIVLLPAFIYYFLKKPSRLSIDTLCMSYHVIAKKK